MTPSRTSGQRDRRRPLWQPPSGVAPGPVSSTRGRRRSTARPRTTGDRLTPGLVTDAIGFLLALPPTRAPVRVVLKRYVVTPYLDEKVEGFVTGGAWTGGFPGPEETVDLDPEDYRDADEESGGKGNV